MIHLSLALYFDGLKVKVAFYLRIIEYHSVFVA